MMLTSKACTVSLCKMVIRCAYIDACRELMPAPTAMMDLCSSVLELDYAAKNDDFSLESPITGFKFHQDYRNDETESLKFKLRTKDIFLKVRLAKDVVIDKKKVKKAVAPNVVHMLDSQLVAGMLLRANYPMSTIHDSFSSCAGDAQELYEDTRDVFSIIFDKEDDVLIEILTATNSLHYLE